jgi:hypothetical protein
VSERVFLPGAIRLKAGSYVHRGGSVLTRDDDQEALLSSNRQIAYWKHPRLAEHREAHIGFRVVLAMNTSEVAE